MCKEFGEKVSDSVAKFGGSWSFILSAAFLIFAWVLWNLVVPPPFRFDPYPFILLNLFLSLIAAFQAPFIMMSQRRAGIRSEREHRRMLKNMHRMLEQQVDVEEEILTIEEEILETLKPTKPRLW